MNRASPGLNGGLEAQRRRRTIPLPRVQIMQEFRGRLVAQVGVALQALADNIAERARNRPVMVGNRNGALLIALDQAGYGALSSERRLPGQQLIKDQAHAEKIGALVQFLCQRLLRRHVFHRPNKSAGLRHSVALNRTGQAEIHHQNAAAPIPHNVLRLHVAVDHAHAMSRFQRAADLLNDLDGLFRRKLFSLQNKSTQVFAFDELHGDELHAIGVAQVVDADHILMSNLMRQQQLLLESRQDRGIRGQLRADELQRHRTV